MKIAVIYHSETGNTKQMAELVREGCEGVGGVEAKCMSIDAIDQAYLDEARAVLLGTPTYEGTCSWQMKRFLDDGPKGLAGKLGGVFATERFLGGGATVAEMAMIGHMLVRGMLVYSTGTSQGQPMTHYGAVAIQAGDEEQQERARVLGKRMAEKALELFGA